MYQQEMQNFNNPINNPHFENKSVSLSNLSHSLQSQPSKLNSQCPLCTQSCPQILISNALYHKHTIQQNYFYTKQIDEIIDEVPGISYIEHKQNMIKDEEEQFMRRFYKLQQYEYKNKAINQYYKFHKDYPKFLDFHVDKIVMKYYQSKKQFEYKRIKKVLKEQQNISITTQKSSSVFSDLDNQDIKSRYSNMLDDMTQEEQNQSLVEDNQSQVLKIICQKIDKAYKHQNISPFVSKKKSIFDNYLTSKDKTDDGDKNFINYLKKQQSNKNQTFLRSNKQSKQNSIEHQDLFGINKQYSSGGIMNSLRPTQRLNKKDKILKTPFLKDRKLYSKNIVNNIKPNFLMVKGKKQERNGEGSDQVYDLRIRKIDNKAFKKIKQISNSNSNSYGTTMRLNNEDKNSQSTRMTRKPITSNNKIKVNQRTTQQIYKYATNQMKKKSMSYNSLGINSKSNRNSISNINLNNKQKPFEVRNISNSQKLLKQKNLLFNHQNNVNNIHGHATTKLRVERSKSTSNFKTISVAKFFDQKNMNTITANQSSKKKIIIPKQIVNTIRGKSLSATKFNALQHYRYDNSQKKLDKQPLKSMNGNISVPQSNLLRQIQSQNSKRTNNQLKGFLKDKQFYPISFNQINVDILLQKKLLLKTTSKNNNKFLI